MAHFGAFNNHHKCINRRAIAVEEGNRSDLSCGKVRLRQRISFLRSHHLVDQAEHRARLDESETDDPSACVSRKGAQGFREGQSKAFG